MLSRLVWTALDTFEIGDLYVGVRSYPDSLSDRIRTLLADQGVEGVDAPPNYSLRLETREPGRNGPRRAYALYRSECLLLRTRRRERVLRGLMHCLHGHVEPSEGRIRARQSAVVGRSGAVILPHELLWRLESLEPRLHASGLWLVDPPYLDIDPEARELILEPPKLDAVSQLRAGPHPVSQGRYPIREWAILGRDTDGSVTSHAALAAIMPLVQGRIDAAVIEATLRILSGVRLTSIRYEQPARMLERLEAGTR